MLYHRRLARLGLARGGAELAAGVGMNLAVLVADFVVGGTVGGTFLDGFAVVRADEAGG
jgi:hypothetical protein